MPSNLIGKYTIKPWICAKLLTIHEETAGGVTVCGRKIGPEFLGWRKDPDHREVSCKACRKIRKRAEEVLNA